MPSSSRLPKQHGDLARRVARIAPRVPRATYRIQLNQEFPFVDAIAIVPYLAELGVSDLYASPVFAAMPGSMHGYDVVDYGRVNDELGGMEGLWDLSRVLQQYAFGLMLDFVPNHMGIGCGANPWWQDVLENGRTSPYAEFFDIDWQPLKPELQDQVLLPVLGDHFGLVLERGELQLRFEDGAFTVHYYAVPLPIAPPTYPLILERALELIGDQFEPDDLRLLELQSIIASFERLAPNHETDADRIAERLREQVVGKHRLSQLAAAEPIVGQAVAQAVEELNGRVGSPASFNELEELLNAQSYRPAYWRVAAEEINYRRFFAINELAAIRQEAPGVLEATHRLLFDLIGAGAVTGVRVDHPDGLWDPAGYFRDVQVGACLARTRAAIDSRRKRPIDDETWGAWLPDLVDIWNEAVASHNDVSDPSLYVVVEKILEPGERVPAEWMVAGTVGYEFARVVTGLFVDSSNRKALDDIYARFTGERVRFNDLVYEQKKQIMRVALASEVNVLARALDRLTEHNRRTRDFTLNSLRNALREIIACFPIYRTYTVCNGSEVSARDRRFIEAAVNEALRRNPASDRGAFVFIRDVLLLDYAEDATSDQRDDVCHVVMKFQQLTGPVMAKGLEDTAFFTYNRLLSLNEVGGDPSAFGSPVQEFHRQCVNRAQRWPGAMLTSSTHDTKRSEDVRARIIAISELPREWRAAVNRWARMNRRHKSRVQGALAPDRNDEYHLYQTLVGVWPFGMAAPDAEFIERITSYMVKAVREGQRHSSWISPGDEYESALTSFIAGILLRDPKNRFLDDFVDIAGRLARIGAFTSLSQQLLKLTAPGVPDIYRGTELWDFSLVDPDNRRPVDFARREAMLAELKGRKPGSELMAELIDDLETGAIKLYLTARALAFRASNAELFARGEYCSLDVIGPMEDRMVAFRRSWNDLECIVVAPRLIGGLLREPNDAPTGERWRGNTLCLDHLTQEARYMDVFSGKERVAAHGGHDNGIDVADILADFPVALLERS